MTLLEMEIKRINEIKIEDMSKEELSYASALKYTDSIKLYFNSFNKKLKKNCLFLFYILIKKRRKIRNMLEIFKKIKGNM